MFKIIPGKISLMILLFTKLRYFSIAITEEVGFEPTIRLSNLSSYKDLANLRFQPLSHSSFLKGVILPKKGLEPLSLFNKTRT